MKPLHDIGVAVIGTGFMCAVHVEALRRVPVRVVGVLGSSPQKSQATAASLGLPKGYASLEELLADPSVDAVHVNTPNRLHLVHTSAAIRAGKHVMCEKPLAMDRHEAAELVRLAAAHPHLVTAVNYNNRFYPLCHEARDVVRRGEAGRLFHVTGSVAQDWLARDTDYNWRVLTSEGGPLRALSDIGSHWLDLVHFVTGLEVEAVLADYATVHPVRRRPKGEVETFSNTAAAATEPVDIATDDYGCVMIRFAGGARGCLWVSQVSPGRKYSVKFEVAGQERTLAWDSEDPERMWVGRRDGASSAVLRNPPELSPAARGVTDYPAGHAEGYPDSFKQCFRAFYKCIAAGDTAVPRTFATFEDGRRDIVLCDAFVESRRRGGWVTIADLAH
ncbi:MAG TPA: Gfo/Idh/MocA family oxidoreductase [Humisphaera sp.]